MNFSNGADASFGKIHLLIRDFLSLSLKNTGTAFLSCKIIFMSEEPTRGGSGLSKSKPLLVALIIILGYIIYSALTRLHHLVESSLGSELAVVADAGISIGVLFLILLGVGLGGILDWVVCKRFLSCKRKTLAPGSKLELFLKKIWGNRLSLSISQSDEAKAFTDLPSGITAEDIDELLMITEQRKRGGKKSAYTDDVQFRAVRDWMTMQAHGTSVTLQQFLEERFGIANETGIPLVPNQTFYGWRKRFLKELKRYKKTQAKMK